MSTETNKQIARSFLQSVDDLDFEAWRATAAPDLVTSANGGDVMNLEEFEGTHAASFQSRQQGFLSGQPDPSRGCPRGQPAESTSSMMSVTMTLIVGWSPPGSG